MLPQPSSGKWVSRQSRQTSFRTPHLSRDTALDAIVFNSILDGCAHKQMRTLTEQVLQDMENAGIAPSNFTLSILVKLYGRCSDIEAAFKVVDTYPARYKF